jgi:hypothetical protein
MVDQVAAAFERQDYRTVARLLKQWHQESPQDPWYKLYLGRYREVLEQWERAEQIYRHLLREGGNPKVMLQARQGLQRFETWQRAQGGTPEPAPVPGARPLASRPAEADGAAGGGGFLVLEAVTGERRAAAAAALAQVMQVDMYTARTVIPNRGWRLYRTGAIADIRRIGEQLQQAGLAVRWVSLGAIQAIKVFQVDYFQTLGTQPTVVCRNDAGQLGAIAFDWSEVGQRVDGRLPIFEQVVELGYRDRPERKEAIQDYAHVCDLHLPQRGCILRLTDQQYDFGRGAELEMANGQGRSPIPQHLTTMRLHWNALLADVGSQVSAVPAWSDYALFADSAPDFEDALRRVGAQIALPRTEFTYWDAAFHLYSVLAF